jgi:hypothetical protein
MSLEWRHQWLEKPKRSDRTDADKTTTQESGSKMLSARE